MHVIKLLSTTFELVFQNHPIRTLYNWIQNSGCMSTYIKHESFITARLDEQFRVQRYKTCPEVLKHNSLFV